jgi:hypothetical protein
MWVDSVSRKWLCLWKQYFMDFDGLVVLGRTGGVDLGGGQVFLLGVDV